MNSLLQILKAGSGPMDPITIEHTAQPVPPSDTDGMCATFVQGGIRGDHASKRAFLSAFPFSRQQPTPQTATVRLPSFADGASCSMGAAMASVYMHKSLMVM